jgi:hypothetical protein
MYTLGTAFGAGAGGAVVALADARVLDLVPALWIVNGIMAVVALAGVIVSTRVPRRPAPDAGPPVAHPTGVLEHS